MWLARVLVVSFAAVFSAFACSSDDDPDASSCPGAASSCPAECPTFELPALTAEGCLTPKVASCRTPMGGTLDAGCVRRLFDDQLFYVSHGGWPGIQGFEDCTTEQYAAVTNADDCTGS